MTAGADDYLVTIRMRVRVTDPERLLQALHERDPRVAGLLSAEPEVALSMAVQDSVPPPDLTGLAGLERADGDETFASVKAEPWPGRDPL